MNVYAKLGINDLASALDALPAVEKSCSNVAAMKATGTDDTGAARRPQPPTQRVRKTVQRGTSRRNITHDNVGEASPRKSMVPATVSNELQRDATGSGNGPCWIRTSDHQIMSPAL